MGINVRTKTKDTPGGVQVWNISESDAHSKLDVSMTC